MSCIFQRFVFGPCLASHCNCKRQQALHVSHFPKHTTAAFSAHSLQFYRTMEEDVGGSRTRNMHSDMDTIVACLRASAAHKPPFTLSFSPCVRLSGPWTPDSRLSTRAHFHSLKPLACYLAIELITDTTSHSTRHPVSCHMSSEYRTQHLGHFFFFTLTLICSKRLRVTFTKIKKAAGNKLYRRLPIFEERIPLCKEQISVVRRYNEFIIHL